MKRLDMLFSRVYFSIYSLLYFTNRFVIGKIIEILSHVLYIQFHGLDNVLKRMEWIIMHGRMSLIHNLIIHDMDY